MSLSLEVRNVQNPALGAALLWRFACGYAGAHATRDAPPLPLAYLVLPLLLHQATARHIKGTLRNSGLRPFAAKFSETRNLEQDVLLSLNGRTRRLRKLSTGSLAIALATRLVHLSDTARLVPLSTTAAAAGLSEEARQLMRDAEKIGAWFSGLTLHEIASILKVRF